MANHIVLFFFGQPCYIFVKTQNVLHFGIFFRLDVGFCKKVIANLSLHKTTAETKDRKP